MNHFFSFRALSFFIIALFLTKNTYASELRIINWNVNAGSVENVAKRKDNFVELGGNQAPDILILQEINSFAAAQLIAKYMGMKDSYLGISNFGKDDEVIYFGLETAMISSIPIVSFDEYQQTVYDRGSKSWIQDPNGPITVSPSGEINYRVNESTHLLEVPADIVGEDNAKQRVSRGLLRVELENGLVIYPVHLKSNRPSLCSQISSEMSDAISNLNKIEKSLVGEDKYLQRIDKAKKSLIKIYKYNGGKNPDALGRPEIQRKLDAFTTMHALTAMSRENGAAALAKLVNKDLKSEKTKGIVIAGDFNTPLNEPSKTGQNLKEDSCMPKRLSCSTKKVINSCGDKDGYDDTHHILSGGVVDGLKMEPLFTDNKPSYIKSGYANSPIDNVYVNSQISDAVISSKMLKDTHGGAFGSDHFPLEITLSLE